MSDNESHSGEKRLGDNFNQKTVYSIVSERQSNNGSKKRLLMMTSAQKSN